MPISTRSIATRPASTMPTSTLTSKGQVTIPKPIRERLGLTAGSRLHFRFLEDGRLVVEPERSGLLGRLPGMLSDFAPSRPVSVEEMREAVRERFRGRESSR